MRCRLKEKLRHSARQKQDEDRLEPLAQVSLNLGIIIAYSIIHKEYRKIRKM